ncbi:MAG: hypothetical protein ACKV2Q_22925 [Planctomycetaceae bacterium]
MSYTKEDFHRDAFKHFFCALRPEDVLEFLSPDQIRILAERSAEQFHQWMVMKKLLEFGQLSPAERRGERATEAKSGRQPKAKSKLSAARTPRTAPPSRSREP